MTVQAPAAWFEIPYHGELGTVVYPLVYLSTNAYTGPCVSGPPKEMCNSKQWFPEPDQGGKALPMLELACIHSVSDSALLLKALQSYRGLINDILAQAKQFGLGPK